AEEITGEVIKGRRDTLLLSSKVRMTMGDGPNDAGLSRQHIIAGCEASLRRLGTDHIDIYHVHEWDGQTRLEETLSALNSLVSAGKVRYLGASNYAGWQLMKALAVADSHGFERFAAQQIYYSLEARDAEYELVPLAVDQGLGILVWSPLAGGLLSGKYRREGSPESGTRQVSGTWNEPPVRTREKLYDTVEILVDIAGAHGASPAQVALAWLLGRPAVTSVIIGARTDEQLLDNLGGASLLLSADERAALDKVSAPELIYPYWHQLNTAADRLGPADLALLAQHLPGEE
ncbi:MAG TPA: aldo/keto reductase, partial [Streptosporangiaceae bacterium]